MPCLSPSDFRRVFAFLEKIHRCRSEKRFPKTVVAELAKLVPADHVIWNYMAPSVPAAQTIAYPELEDEDRRNAVFAEHMREHPVIEQMFRTGDPNSRKISDFWSPDEFHRTGIYDVLYRDMRTEDQMGFWLSGLAPEMVGIAFNRSRRNFTETERTLLDLVRPQVALAWRNARAFSRVRKLALTNRHANVQLGKSIVSLDGIGRVTRLPARARQWLAEFYDDPLHGGRSLPGGLSEWVVGQLTEGSTKRSCRLASMPLVRERDGRQLVVRLFRDTGGWLLVLERLLHAPTTQGLRRVGLTPREIAVLLEVEKGRTNKEIAAALFISPLTARKHLENIFDKLRVTTRTAAIFAAHQYVNRGRINPSEVGPW